MQRYKKEPYTLLYNIEQFLKKSQKRTIYVHNDCLFTIMLYLCIAIEKTNRHRLRVLTERLEFFYFAVFKKAAPFHWD